MMYRVYVTGRQHTAILTAMVALEMEAAPYELVEIKPISNSNILPLGYVLDGAHHHGPQVKGRGGKIKRW